MERKKNEFSIWALKYADGSYRAPDHFVTSATSDPKQAKPFFGNSGKFYAGEFANLSPGSEVVLHPHPELGKNCIR